MTTMIELNDRMYFVTSDRKVEDGFGKVLKSNGAVARKVLKLYDEERNKNKK